MSTETLVSSPSRRNFLQTAGASGLALGAGALLAGCGGGGNGNNGGFPRNVGITASSITLGFQSLQADENNHVLLIKTALGANARPAPTFSSPYLTAPQTDINTFAALAGALGNTETGTYVGAVPIAALDADQTMYTVGAAQYTSLELASAIAIVEGRHAGFFNILLGQPCLTNPENGDKGEPANQSREVPFKPSETAARAEPFIGAVDQNGIPALVSLNGGPPLLTDNNVANASVLDIFNYALFFEYLGSTFYNLNVPHFFG